MLRICYFHTSESTENFIRAISHTHIHMNVVQMCAFCSVATKNHGNLPFRSNSTYISIVYSIYMFHSIGYNSIREYFHCIFEQRKIRAWQNFYIYAQFHSKRNVKKNLDTKLIWFPIFSNISSKFNGFFIYACIFKFFTFVLFFGMTTTTTTKSAHHRI